MNVGSVCKRRTITISARADLTEAARLMREHHVGYLIATESEPPRPVGVVTDRDIVISVVAEGADPKSLLVGDVMSEQPVTIGETDSVREALQTMRRMGVRRLPVVGSRGELTGILALDDVLEIVAREMADVSGTLSNEQRIEGVLRT